MQLFGLSITRTKAAPTGALQPADWNRGWWPWFQETFAGQWQLFDRRDDQTIDNLLSYSPVYACVDLISSDIGKLELQLMAEDANGISTETESAAFSPVLRVPNDYQTRIQFLEVWIVSKLLHGNSYILKRRDNRGIVTALYVLDPCRVRAFISPDGSVFYELRKDVLAEVPDETVMVPAREIIHDRMMTPFHPLVGVSPLFAAGIPALQGLKIQSTSARFFANHSQPGGVLTAPGVISDATAARLKASWETNFSGANAGKVAVLGDGLKYEQMTVTADKAQLSEQLKGSAESVCTAFRVPPYMIGVGPPPTFNNIEALNQQYYSQCLQRHIESIEILLDQGLELPKPYHTELDLNGLLRMDTATLVKAASDAIGSGAMTINEARRRYFELGPVEGGDTCYLQQQDYSIEALSRRDAAAPAPSATPAPAPIPPTDAAAKALEVLAKTLTDRVGMLTPIAADEDGDHTALLLQAFDEEWEADATA